MNQVDVLDGLKRIRKAKGLSQLDMASALHIALKTYQNIEGGVTRIDIDRLTQIAGVLNVGVYELLGAEDRISEEKKLYNKIIRDKEVYIAKLEDSVRFYRELLKENIAI